MTNNVKSYGRNNIIEKNELEDRIYIYEEKQTTHTHTHTHTHTIIIQV